jgi:hypothetical protein
VSGERGERSERGERGRNRNAQAPKPAETEALVATEQLTRRCRLRLPSPPPEAGAAAVEGEAGAERSRRSRRGRRGGRRNEEGSNEAAAQGELEIGDQAQAPEATEAAASRCRWSLSPPKPLRLRFHRRRSSPRLHRRRHPCLPQPRSRQPNRQPKRHRLQPPNWPCRPRRCRRPGSRPRVAPDLDLIEQAVAASRQPVIEPAVEAPVTPSVVEPESIASPGRGGAPHRGGCRSDAD